MLDLIPRQLDECDFKITKVDGGYKLTATFTVVARRTIQYRMIDSNSISLSKKNESIHGALKAQIAELKNFFYARLTAKIKPIFECAYRSNKEAALKQAERLLQSLEAQRICSYSSDRAAQQLTEEGDLLGRSRRSSPK